MCKTIEHIWKIKGGKNKSEEEIDREVREGFMAFIGKVKQAESEIEPPKTLTEFEDRLCEYLDSQFERTFGHAHYLPDKTLRNEVSIKNLIEINIELEKQSKKEKLLSRNVIMNGYEFLKLALEKNYPFSQIHQNFLGIQIDRSGISLPQKNEIAIQCAAQVLWNIEKGRIGNIESMIQYLLQSGSSLYELLEINRFHNRRTIRNWISPIFPIPIELRKKGRRCDDQPFFDDIKPIPNIRCEGIEGLIKTNFLKLRFAVFCLARILKLCGWESDKIIASKFIFLIQDTLLFYPRMCVQGWALEAYSSDGRIFDL